MVRRYGIYLVAIGATAVAWMADILLRDLFSESSVALFIAAVLVSAWYGGWSAGVFAIGLTVALNLIFFRHPYLSMAVGVHGFERLIVFAVVSLLVTWLTAKTRRSENLLRRLSQDLEEQVRRRTAALSESNRQLEAFCYTLAHDLKSPLRAIQGFSHLLLSEHGAAFDAESREHVERIRNSAERMGRLIVDLLRYTELERTAFSRQAVDLGEVCQEVQRLLQDEIQRAQAEVSLELAAGHVQGDRAGVECILLNLLANALKFVHPDRLPRIRIRSEQNRPSVRVWVEDNGIGLDPKYHERIFGVFQRLQGTGEQTGTGIGLAMVRKSAEKMGGKTGVESTVGVGSRFWFELAELPDPDSANAGDRDPGSRTVAASYYDAAS
jgi:signal transduction histidine kinase